MVPNDAIWKVPLYCLMLAWKLVECGLVLSRRACNGSGGTSSGGRVYPRVCLTLEIPHQDRQSLVRISVRAFVYHYREWSTTTPLYRYISRCRRQAASSDLSRLCPFTPEGFSNGAIREEPRDQISEMIGDVR